jgi:hypothetical protein
MMEKSAKYDVHIVENMIITIRGQKVILDHDLAALYGVETGALNRAVKRNPHRFPPDFAFRLTAEEDKALRCQFGISKGRGGLLPAYCDPPPVFYRKPQTANRRSNVDDIRLSQTRSLATRHGPR